MPAKPTNQGAGKVSRPPIEQIKARCQRWMDGRKSGRIQIADATSEDDEELRLCLYIKELERRAKALADAGHRLRHIWADDNAASAMQWDEDEKALRELTEGK